MHSRKNLENHSWIVSLSHAARITVTLEALIDPGLEHDDTVARDLQIKDISAHTRVYICPTTPLHSMSDAFDTLANNTVGVGSGDGMVDLDAEVEASLNVDESRQLAAALAGSDGLDEAIGVIPSLLSQYTDKLKAAGCTSSFEGYSVFTPATDEDIAQLSQELQCVLPDDLETWLRTVNCELPMMGNYQAMSCNFILTDIRAKSQIDFTQHRANLEPSHFDHGRLADTYWHKFWLPIAMDGCGNQYCYDLAPGPNGVSGQLIAMEFQDGQGPYMAQWSSLDELLREHLDALDSRAYTIEDESGIIEFD